MIPEVKVQKIVDGIWLLPIPIPNFGAPSNAYIIEDKILTFVDSGVPQQYYLEIVKSCLAQIGRSLEEVDQVIYTHHHLDHAGGGVLLSQQHQMKHFIGHSVTEQLRDADKVTDPIRLIPEIILNRYPKFRDFVDPNYTVGRYTTNNPKIGFLEGEIVGLRDGDVINLGNRKLRVLSTPGHTPHDIMLFDNIDGLLFCGDSLITASTSFCCTDEGNIQNNLQSMARLEQELGEHVKQVLSGHAPVMQVALSSVIGNSRRTISRYSDKIIKYLEENGRSSAVDVFMQLHGKSHPSWLSIFCTTVTYLEYLTSQGRLKEDEPGYFSISQ